MQLASKLPPREHVLCAKARAAATMRASLRRILGVLLCSQEVLSLRVPPPLASRRRWLAGAGAAAAASAVPALASAAPSFVSSLQGPVQDAVAPGHWLGKLVGINSTWSGLGLGLGLANPNPKPNQVSSSASTPRRRSGPSPTAAPPRSTPPLV